MLGSPAFVYYIEESNNIKHVGILGYMILVQSSQSFDTKVSNTDGQLCICDPIRSLDTAVWVNFQEWHSHNILSHIIAGRS